jgi:hypothetical protein
MRMRERRGETSKRGWGEQPVGAATIVKVYSFWG